MLIADEVQSGFARTGNWASWQNYNVTPDISTYAKSMGSGLPIAAVVGKADIMDAAAPGTIGGTYIGSPLSCVAASATIQYMKDVNLNERGTEIGNITRNRLDQLKKICPDIGDIRGQGAMIAIEFVKNGDSQKPNGDLCGKIVASCLKRGLIILNAGTYKNIIRILSPLVITDAQLNQGLDILEQEILNISKNKR
jgi:4-aminobutyrate aminotransferase/(S)-3-amino-2-methylpropionate transaminase